MSELQEKLYAQFHPQLCHLETQTTSDISLLVQSLRTAKALPLVLSTPLKIAHQLPNRTKTVTDQELIVCQEGDDFMPYVEKLKALLPFETKVVKTFHGYNLIAGEGTDEKEVKIEQPNQDGEELLPMEKVYTPNCKSMQALEDFIKRPKSLMTKLVEF